MGKSQPAMVVPANSEDLQADGWHLVFALKYWGISWRHGRSWICWCLQRGPKLAVFPNARIYSLSIEKTVEQQESAKAYLLSNLMMTILPSTVFVCCWSFIYVCGSSLVLKERAGVATALWKGHQDVLSALPPLLTWQHCVHMLFKLQVSALSHWPLPPRHLPYYYSSSLATISIFCLPLCSQHLMPYVMSQNHGVWCVFSWLLLS